MTLTVTARTLIVAVSLLGGAAYLAKATKAEAVPLREPLTGLPMRIDQWVGRREPDFTPQIRAVLGVDDYITRTYYTAGTAVGLYVGYYESQRQGDTIHSPLNCLPGAGWQPSAPGRRAITVRTAGGTGATRPIEVNRVEIRKGLDRQLVLYWYQSHERVVASEYWGKVYTVLDAIRYNRTDAALVRVIVPISDDSQAREAEAQAVSFVQAIFPLLGRYLPV